MAINPKSLANLRPSMPGEVRNPSGINGRRRQDLFRAYADETADVGIDQEHSRIYCVWQQLFRDATDLRASMKSVRVVAQKTFIEQYQGLPVAGMELSGVDGGPIQSTFDPLSLNSEQREARLAELMGIARMRREAAEQALAEEKKRGKKKANKAKRKAPPSDDGSSETGSG